MTSGGIPETSYLCSWILFVTFFLSVWIISRAVLGSILSSLTNSAANSLTVCISVLSAIFAVFLSQIHLRRPPVSDFWFYFSDIHSVQNYSQ